MNCEICHRKHDGPCNAEMATISIQQDRLSDIIRRHVRVGDMILSDRDFTLAVFERWRRDSGAHISDVADGVDMKDFFND